MLSFLRHILKVLAVSAAVYQDTQITAGTTSNSVNLALPAGAAAGDWAAYGFTQDAANTGTLTSDGGATQTLRSWVQIQSFRRGAWVKQLTGTDITNGYIQLTYTTGGAEQGVGFVATWRGGAPTFSLQEETSTGGLDNTTITSADPTGTADYLFHAFLDDDLSTVSTWPTSYTSGRKQAQAGVANSGGTGAVAVAVGADPGAESFVFSTSDEISAMIIKVAP